MASSSRRDPAGQPGPYTRVTQCAPGAARLQRGVQRGRVRERGLVCQQRGARAPDRPRAPHAVLRVARRAQVRDLRVRGRGARMRAPMRARRRRGVELPGLRRRRQVSEDLYCEAGAWRSLYARSANARLHQRPTVLCADCGAPQFRNTCSACARSPIMQAAGVLVLGEGGMPAHQEVRQVVALVQEEQALQAARCPGSRGRQAHARARRPHQLRSRAGALAPAIKHEQSVAAPPSPPASGRFFSSGPGSHEGPERSVVSATS